MKHLTEFKDEVEEIRSSCPDWSDEDIYSEIFDRADEGEYPTGLRNWIRRWGIYEGYYRPVTEEERANSVSLSGVPWFKLDGCFYEWAR